MSPARTADVVVVGGGPAGLAAAIAAAAEGLEVVVLERRPLPADRACGEGILPGGVAALEALGVRDRLDPAAVSPLSALRWVDGARVAEARLPAPGGLGVRRTALSVALAGRARALGVEVREGVRVRAHRRTAACAEVEIEGDRRVRARLLVAADGPASPIRRREGLEAPLPASPRYGLRQHFAVPPWSDAVEVHFAEGVEAYVTPVGPGQVGVAFLCESGDLDRVDALLARFPRLAERLAGAPTASAVAGAGPLARPALRRTLDRLVLLGDAGGALDAVTGEGLSLALQGATALGRALPRALREGATARALGAWALGEAARRARAAAVTRLVLGLARRPRLRGRVLDHLAGRPRLFEALVRAAVGAGEPEQALPFDRPAAGDHG